MEDGMCRIKANREKKLSDSFSTEKTLQKLVVPWSISEGLKIHGITSSIFPETGRGLKTTRYVEKGDVVITIPRRLLINFDTIWGSGIKTLLLKKGKQLNPKSAFTLFLTAEKGKGRRSFYYNYINSLPVKYNTPSFIPNSFDKMLPEFILDEKNAQLKKINDQLKNILDCLAELKSKKMKNEYSGISITFDDVRWAWSVVNTRSVYFNNQKLKCISEINVLDVNFSLAPVLDLLNHKDSANIVADFNTITDCYEIQTFDTYTPGDQLFINYGAHSNRTLLCEYGFILDKNKHTHLPIKFQLIKKYFCCGFPEVEIDKHCQFLKTIGLDVLDIGCTATEFEWNFLVAAHVLVSNSSQRTTNGYLDGELSKPCNGQCIIFEGCRHLISDMMEHHRSYVESLKDSSCEPINMICYLLKSEMIILQDIKRGLTEKCLL